MTEKELRDLEKLKTTDDYIEEIRRVKETVCATKKADKKIDDTLELLATALYDKYKYIIDISKPYRKKQGWFSKIADWREERRLKKLRKKAEQEEKDQQKKAAEQEKEAAEQKKTAKEDTKSEQSRDTTLLASPQSKIEVLDNPKDVKMLSQSETADPNPQDGG